MSVVAVAVVAFVIAFVGSMPLAGPIAVLVVSRSAKRAFAEARHVAYGASAAEGIYAGLAFFGFSALLARHHGLLTATHGVTTLVLLAVGVHFVRWRHDKSKDDEGERSKQNRRAPFVLGFTLSALNPTLLVTWSAVTSALYARHIVDARALYAIPFGAAAGAGAAAWNAVLVKLLERYEDRFPEKVVTWSVRAMGGVLVALAVWSGADFVRELRG